MELRREPSAGSRIQRCRYVKLSMQNFSWNPAEIRLLRGTSRFEEFFIVGLIKCTTLSVVHSYSCIQQHIL